MGQDFWSDLGPWITRGADLYSQYQERQIKEIEQESAEAQAAAAKARADAAAAAAANAQAQAAASSGSSVMGIPTQYVLIGAVGVGVLGLMAVLLR